MTDKKIKGTVTQEITIDLDEPIALNFKINEKDAEEIFKMLGINSTEINTDDKHVK
jgi:hypothetical protein